MTHLALSPSGTGHDSDRWGRLARATSLTGLSAFVLIFAPIIAISTLGEPPFTATAEQASAFFAAAAGTRWVATANAAVVLGALAMIWFLVGLSLLLARAEGVPPWRSGAGLVSGVLFPAYAVLDGSWDAAGNRGADLDPGLAAYAFDVGNLGFANTWVALGGFAIAAGWVLLSTRMLGRWLGWWAIFSGGGLVVARFVWASQLWLLPYFLFWIWVVVVCVQLIRTSRFTQKEISHA